MPQIYKFPQSSLAELARNSVRQSGFEMEVKRHWLGHQWYLPGAAGNDIHKTNVPDIRLAYRHTTLLGELEMIRRADSMDKNQPPTAKAPSVALPTINEDGMPKAELAVPRLQVTPETIAAKAMGSS